MISREKRACRLPALRASLQAELFESTDLPESIAYDT
jgi:hypothetical protein